MTEKGKAIPTLDQFLVPTSESWADVEDVHDQPLFQESELQPAPEPEPEAAQPEEPHQHERDLPSGPPYQAYVGNLAFSCQKDDLYLFFENCTINSVRMVTDKHNGNFKGFCYLEFADVESLRTALGKDGKQLLNRPTRVDVAEPRDHSEHRGAGHRHRASRSSSHWNRADDREHRLGAAAAAAGDRREPRDVRRHDAKALRSPRKVSQDEPLAEHRAPAERKKLALLPRSSSKGAASVEQRSSKTNPFGEARPREEVLANRPVAPVAAEQQKKQVPPRDFKKEELRKPRESHRDAHGKPSNGTSEREDAVVAASAGSRGGRRPARGRRGGKSLVDARPARCKEEKVVKERPDEVVPAPRRPLARAARPAPDAAPSEPVAQANRYGALLDDE